MGETIDPLSSTISEWIIIGWTKGRLQQAKTRGVLIKDHTMPNDILLFD